MLKVTGLTEFQRKLEDMARQAESLSGNHSVPIPDLLTPDFLSRCSRFHSAQEMFDASGFKIEVAGRFCGHPRWRVGSIHPRQHDLRVLGGNAGRSRR